MRLVLAPQTQAQGVAHERITTLLFSCQCIFSSVSPRSYFWVAVVKDHFILGGNADWDLLCRILRLLEAFLLICA